MVLTACRFPQEQSLNPELFRNPPPNVRLHAYWQWIDGCVSREGISRDLEAMKQQGIRQVAILCVSMFDGKELGVSKVKFAGNEWLALFRWTLQEANRLGIFVGVHNGNGWSGSSGPWITPDQSMKNYTWTKIRLSGGKEVETMLKKPAGVLNFYRDVAVVAFQSGQVHSVTEVCSPEIRINRLTDGSALADGSPVSAVSLNKGDTIDFRYEKPHVFNRLALFPYHPSMWGEAENFVFSFKMLVSGDGKTYRHVSDLRFKGSNRQADTIFTDLTARYIRFILTGSSNQHFQVPASLGEFELLKSSEQPLFSSSIPDFLEKAAFVRSKQDQYFSLKKEISPGKIMEGASLVLNITSSMDTTGLLRWKAPPGNWTVIRFGYTTTGASGNPVSREEAGLECDKMDTTALNLHFSHFPAQLIKEAGNFTGNTFRFLLSDSYECSYTNWTAALPAEFEKRTRYSLIPWIPVLCGEVPGSIPESESFLYDFRSTIASLIEEHYYRHLSNLCHRNNLEFHAEVIYGNYSYPPLDILKTNSCVDFPMTEFWTASNTESKVEYMPSSRMELHLPVSAGSAYGIKVIGAEAYTGLANFSESPGDLKPFADRAYCEGINQFVLHSYVHQPDERKPGITLGRYASHFNRHNLYWPYMGVWGDYHARIQYVLQQGRPVNDVLYYLGDQLPQFNYENQSNRVPSGYHVTACNFDILKNRIRTAGGKIILNDRDTAALLTFPPFPFMNLETLMILEKLVKEGISLYCPKPLYTLNRNDFIKGQKEFAQLANRMWGAGNGNSVMERKYGKGNIFWGMSLEEVLRKITVFPDLTTGQDDSSAILFTHRRAGDIDIFFVANQMDASINRELLFRISGKTPWIWDPVDGTIIKPAVYNSGNGQTRIPVTLLPHQSYIFVFKPEKPEEYIVSAVCNGKQLFPCSGKQEQLPFITVTDSGFVMNSDKEGNYLFVTNNGRLIARQFKSTEETEISGFSGNIRFLPAYDASIPDISITTLKSLTEYPDPDVRYFAGEAQYTLRFKVPDGLLTSGNTLILDIGDFGSTAKVILNGVPLGSYWQKPPGIEVTPLLKPENTLEVFVTNVYRNRIIGDLVQYGRMKNLWTPANVTEFLDKGKPLKPSGWIGPLKIKTMKKTPL